MDIIKKHRISAFNPNPKSNNTTKILKNEIRDLKINQISDFFKT